MEEHRSVDTCGRTREGMFRVRHVEVFSYYVSIHSLATSNKQHAYRHLRPSTTTSALILGFLVQFTRRLEKPA